VYAPDQGLTSRVTSLENDFTPEQLAKIDEIIQKNRGKPGAMIQVLKNVQEVTGYLPPDLQNRIAKGLNLSFSEVFGVATFYSYFKLQPVGRHQIKVCMGTACYVRGNKNLIETLCRDLDCEVGGTTEDRRFTMEGVRCLGCCGIAPVITINDDVHREVQAKDVPPILNQYQ